MGPQLLAGPCSMDHYKLQASPGGPQTHPVRQVLSCFFRVNGMAKAAHLCLRLGLLLRGPLTQVSTVALETDGLEWKPNPTLACHRPVSLHLLPKVGTILAPSSSGLGIP